MIERFKYTDIKCKECGGTVVLGSRGDLYCLDCGLVHNHINYGYGFKDHKWRRKEVTDRPDEWREENEFTKK